MDRCAKPGLANITDDTCRALAFQMDLDDGSSDGDEFREFAAEARARQRERTTGGAGGGQWRASAGGAGDAGAAEHIDAVVDSDDEVIDALRVTAKTAAKDGEGRFWMCTVHTPNATHAEMQAVFDGWAAMHSAGKEFCVVGQAEIGEGGKYHANVYFEFPTNHKLARLRKEFGAFYFAKRFARSSQQHCIDYVTKEDTRATGDMAASIKIGDFKAPQQGKRTDIASAMDAVRSGLAEGKTATAVLRTLAGGHADVYVKYHQGMERAIALLKPDTVADDTPSFDKLWGWQQRLARRVFDTSASSAWGAGIVAPAPPRDILFVVDQLGNSGKSTMTSYMQGMAPQGAVIELMGDVKDMAYAFSQQIAEIACFDVSRSDTKNWQSYCWLAEALGNGRLMQGKYVSQMITFKRPHVIFFCNALPPNLGELLSVDRIKVWEVKRPTALHMPGAGAGAGGVAPHGELTFADASAVDDYVAKFARPVRAGMNF